MRDEGGGCARRDFPVVERNFFCGGYCGGELFDIILSAFVTFFMFHLDVGLEH